MTDSAGLLLAAGAGTRMGRPKALVTDDAGVPWVVRSARVLRDGGCDPVVVVVGAEAPAVRDVLAGEAVRIVEAHDWTDGMAASLRAGLAALADSDAISAVVHLVDLPDVGPDVVARLLVAASSDVLARATYASGAGHPVLLGRRHWSGVAQQVGGDRGARDYLAGREVIEITCSDLATGHDVDRPEPRLGR